MADRGYKNNGQIADTRIWADRGYKNMGRSRIQEYGQIADTRTMADRGYKNNGRWRIQEYGQIADTILKYLSRESAINFKFYHTINKCGCQQD